MFLLFHAFIPLFLYEIPKIKERFQAHRFALLLGSLAPDLIDKPLSLFSDSFGGRGIGHTPILQLTIILVLVLYEYNRKPENYAISWSYSVGTLFHLLLDIPSVPWLYPIVQYNFLYEEDLIESWFYTLFHNPLIISTELIGLFGLVAIGYKNALIFKQKKLIDIERTKDYLFKLETRINT